MKKCNIVHGWEGKPDSNWFPWLSQKLEAENFEVNVPVMPNAAHPKRDEWLKTIKEAVGQPDENTYMVGHSLGVVSVLKYIEHLPEGQKIGGAVLAAGFIQSIDEDEIADFLNPEVNCDVVKQKAGKIVLIHSDNDPYVPLEQGEYLKRKLDAELIVLPGKGHLNEQDGVVELPEALNALIQMSRKS